MSDIATSRWKASDDVELAWHECGSGPPVVLLHGLFSDANMNWIKFGHAARIAEAGFRVIMPDLRAHGASGAPHGEEYYPKVDAADFRANQEFCVASSDNTRAAEVEAEESA
jgi:pimeloyl-ACP methyl ester carboxylesterase